MKTKSYFLSLLIGLIFLSCQKAPINGDLDGQWQVVEVTPKPAQVNIQQRIYYNFSLHVCSLSYYGGTLAYANMRYSGDELYLDFPSLEGNESLTLRQYGILSNPVVFNVKFTDRHHLILSNDESVVMLVKL